MCWVVLFLFFFKRKTAYEMRMSGWSSDVCASDLADTPPVLVYDTGANRWARLQAWPQSCAEGCAATSKPLYLRAGGVLSFEAPVAGQAGYDESVYDPAKPLPSPPRPVAFRAPPRARTRPVPSPSSSPRPPALLTSGPA